MADDDSRGINPFYDDDDSAEKAGSNNGGKPFDDDDDSTQGKHMAKLQTIRFGRGALMRGEIPECDNEDQEDEQPPSPPSTPPPSTPILTPPIHQPEEIEPPNTKQPDDLESGFYPPDSDYASEAPRSLFQSSLSSVQTFLRSNTSADKNKRRRQWILIGLVAVSVLLIGAVIAVAVVVFGGGGNSDNNAPPKQLDARQQVLSDVAYTASNKDLIENPSKPQYHAHNWLVFEDTLWLQPSSPIPRERVVQRYALAVFYFSTGGPVSWGVHNWMTGLSECGTTEWTGLDCDDQEQVRAIAFGKLFKGLYG